MAALIVVLALLSIGIVGCSQREVPDAPVAAPSLTGSAPPAIRQGVAGRVVDDRAQPIARALIQPRSLDTNAAPIPEIAVFSNADGAYAWQLAPGRYEFTVTTDGYQAATVQAIVNSSQVTILDFSLERLP
jgi:hypothetical protein